MTEPGTSKFKMAEKIAAILKKAESTEFAAEAEALTAQAEKMMLRYGIEQAVINAKRAGKKHAADEQMLRVIMNFTGVYAKAMRMAMISVIHAFNTARHVVDTQKSGKTTSELLWILGYESDVRQLEMLIVSLQLQCVSALTQWWNPLDTTGWTAMEKFKARREFIISFGEGVAYRILNARMQAVKESSVGEPGTALALINRTDEVERWMNETFRLKTVKNRGMARGGGGSSTAGWNAGKNANTGEGALKQTKQISG